MNPKDFEAVVRGQYKQCSDLLLVKAAEYAPIDRLANFKTAAGLQGRSPIEALSGMMAKHTVSIYDMIASGEPHAIEKWDEKITDHINYLLLLKAILVEAQTENEKEANA